MFANNSPMDRVVAIFILIAWTIWQTAVFWNSWAIDMSAIYFAAHFAWIGEPGQIFASPEYFFGTDRPEAWLALRDALGHVDQPTVPYVYPPVWAYLLAPIAGNTDPVQFFNFARLILFGCFSATIYCVWAMIRDRTPMGAAAFSALSVVVAWQTIPYQFGAGLAQPQFVVFLLIAWAFQQYLAGNSSRAGIALGFAAALKITPVLLVLVFILDRDIRASLSTLATAAVLALASILIAGWPLHAEMLEKMRLIEASVPLVGLNTNLEVFIHQIFVPESLRVTISTFEYLAVNVPIVSWITRVGLVSAVLGTVWATANLDRSDRTVLRLFGVYTCVYFFGPLSWIHYYILTFVMFPALVHIVGFRLVLGCMVPLCALSSMFVTLEVLEADSGFGLFQTLFAPILFCAVAATLVAARRRPVEGKSAPKGQQNLSVMA